MNAVVTQQPAYLFSDEETLFFQNRRGQMLFGVSHQTPVQGEFAVVICAPFGEERNRSYRALVEFSRQLAAAGTPVFRFDYFGSGESDGRMHHADLDTHIEDTQSAIQFARNRFNRKRLLLVGLRYGAMVAALTAEKTEAVSDLLLLCPVLKGKHYWRELLRIRQLAVVAMGQPAIKSSQLIAELSANGVLEIEAQLISEKWVEQVQSIDLVENPIGFTGNIRVSRLSQDSLATQQLEKLAQNHVLDAASVKIWSDETEDYWSNLGLYEQRVPQQSIDACINWIAQMERAV